MSESVTAEAVLSHLDDVDAKHAAFVSQVDAFVEGVESYTKQSNYTEKRSADLWAAILYQVGELSKAAMAKSAVDGASAFQATPGMSPSGPTPMAYSNAMQAPQTPNYSEMFQGPYGGAYGQPYSLPPTAPGVGFSPDQASSMAAAPPPTDTPAPQQAAPAQGGGFWPQVSQMFQDPQTMARALALGVPAAAGSGLLTALLSRGEGRTPWLRNALLGGGLTALAYPLIQAYRARQNQPTE